MITALRGVIREASAGALVVQVGPVDLRVFVPTSLSKIAEPGARVELFTHLALRPDQIALYGFTSRQALELFELLVGVSGVGPKLALSVLSAFEAAALCETISRGDAQGLARAPGVGPRAASRIVAELGDKLRGLAPLIAADGASSYNQALAALIDLGYALSEARTALDTGPKEGSIEELIRSALAALADRPGR